MCKQSKRILLVCMAVFVTFLASGSLRSPVGDLETAHVALANPGSVKINSLMVFGPAPITLGDTVGHYMWVIGEVKNNLNSSQSVTLSLDVGGAPLGCEQSSQLIMPGKNPFTLIPSEAKWVLYRVRFECRPPASPGVLGLNISLCISGVSGSDCLGRSKSLCIDEPPYELHADSSDIERAWFTFCFEPPFNCLTPWPIDWSALSYHEVGFLGGSPDAIYLRWFSHGVHIYDYDQPGRPFGVIPAWETRLSYLECYGCLWYDEEELSQYTTTGGCGEFLLPPEERILCTSGHVGYTYIDPEFHGRAYLICEGPFGTECRGLEGIDYYYHY